MTVSSLLKALMIPLMINIPILVVLIFFIFPTTSEALTGDQIPKKKNWTKWDLNHLF